LGEGIGLLGNRLKRAFSIFEEKLSGS